MASVSLGMEAELPGSIPKQELRNERMRELRDPLRDFTPQNARVAG